MSLTASMEIARSSLSTLTERSAVVSRNVANAGNDYATRKIAHTVTGPNASGVRLAAITRATDAALFNNVLGANASVGAQEAIIAGLDQLNQTVGDPEQDSSPAALIGKLGQALQQYSDAPQESARAKGVVDAAGDLAQALNSATDAVQRVRADADAAIERSVIALNDLLANVERINREIVKGTQTGADITDHLDTRDRLLTEISGHVAIRTVTRADNDMAIYTDSGVTLFDNTARQVSFERTLFYSAAVTGNAVMVDGVAVTGPTASMAIGSGRLKGLADIRDSIAVTYQNQLDEIARGLIETFAERDQSAPPSLPDATGLFTYSGSPAVPPSGTVIPGIAGEIAVSAAVDPAQGGNPLLIRDGGIAGPAYTYNTTSAAGFSARILELSDNLFAARSFDPLAEAGAQDSVADYATSSVGWLQELRSSVTVSFQFNQTLQERSIDALNAATGINLDYEMTLLLEIERSFQATSRLIQAIDNMYGSLLAAV